MEIDERLESVNVELDHLRAYNKILRAELDALKGIHNDAPKYLFSRIPNNAEGQALLAEMRKYLNTDRYSLRARGQGRPTDGKSWNHYRYGAPLKVSPQMRIYVEEKR